MIDMFGCFNFIVFVTQLNEKKYAENKTNLKLLQKLCFH